MKSDEEVEQDYDDTCEENRYLFYVYSRYKSPERFLRRSEKIFARGIRLDDAAASVWLNYVTDIDGCVVELKSITGYKGVVRHITLCGLDKISLKYIKGVLKKHVDLDKYSKDELSIFNNCLGTQVFYEGGWECWIGLIPLQKKRALSLSRERVADIANEYFCGLRNRFRKKLCDYAVRGIARRTLMKNDLNDLRKVFVLPDDSAVMLAALQGASEGFNSGTFRPIVFCFRFGEKMRDGIEMTRFDGKMIAKVTVHAAVDISSHCDIALMWSMNGLQEVVGTRGTLSTCLSFSDCGNFQSNLDGRLLAIGPELLQICRYPEKVKFVQMYADLPHRKPKSRFHPVSGVIAGGMCFPKSTVDAYCKDSLRYLSTLDSNWSLMTRSTCRLEIVSEIEVSSDTIQATDVLDVAKVNALVQLKPMLVPLPPECLVCIRQIGLSLKNELERLLEQFQKTGNVEATWCAFQLELASEKLLWGRPLCSMSSRYSVNLGPGVLATSRSVTDDLGFLALEEWSSCLSGEDNIPPYCIWIQSETTGKCMMRAAGLHDYIDSKSFTVIGRRLVFALLQDLHAIGKVGTFYRFGEYLAELKSEKTRFKTVAAITAKSLCEVLVAKRRLALHMVFGLLCNLVTKADMPLISVLDAGLKELKLKYFPAVQTYDKHGNQVLSWSFTNSFWSIVYCEKSVEPTAVSAQIYSDLVKGELERRGLIFPSKLKMIHGPFPWISCCVHKLMSEKLDDDRTVTTLSLISCIAFIMQGWFVDYDRLRILISDLPVTQGRLKTLEILSKLQLANVRFKELTLYRLHHSVPHQFQTAEASTSRLQSADKVQETDIVGEDLGKETTSRIGDDDEENVVVTHHCNIEHRQSLCKPVGVAKTKWSGKEMEILYDVAQMRDEKTMTELYNAFREKCLLEQIPFRTKEAFRCKFLRLNFST